MKRFTLVLALCLLLAGCAGEAAPDAGTTLPPTPETTAVTEAAGYYDPASELEAATGGAVRVYPLTDMEAASVLPLGDSFLVFSSTEVSTRLTVLSGDTLYPAAEAELAFFLSAEDTSLRRWEDGISFFDPTVREVVVLDSRLKEISRIPVPEDMVETPILSDDRTALYYCTDSAIWAMDLDSGIRRILKEISCPFQSTTNLLLNGTVLECSLSDENFQWETLYISTETGQTLHSTEDSLFLRSAGDCWYGTWPDGSMNVCAFGRPGEAPQTLNGTELVADYCSLPQANAVVQMTSPDEAHITLDYFDLNTGLRSSSLTLETGFYPWCMEAAGDGRVAFLNYNEDGSCVNLYLWEIGATPTGDTRCYTGLYYGRENPDYDGLSACSLYAQELSQRYGVEILVYQDALEVQPWDYEFTCEYQPQVLMQELEQLDTRLQNYPEGFLQRIGQQYNGLKIALVREISGAPETGSLETAQGVQFWDEEYTAYLALSTLEDTEYTLYHELYHLIDTVVLNESNGFDQWDLLNPVGFFYDFDYISNQTRNSDEYLREEKRYFIDTYSMSYPKEDRARIMEYAMTEGNEHYFACETMQNKLLTLCQGIRKAFGLRKSPESFLWEQYLKESLAYTE